jgi:hypothetical protein
MPLPPPPAVSARLPTRLESLLAVIWAAQQEQSAALRRLQAGVDRLLERADDQHRVGEAVPEPQPLQMPWSDEMNRLAVQVQRAHVEQQRLVAAATATVAASHLAVADEDSLAVDSALLSLIDSDLRELSVNARTFEGRGTPPATVRCDAACCVCYP